MKLAALAVALLLSAFIQGQKVAGYDWDAAKSGPLMAVDPAVVKGKRLSKVGSLTAVVPTEMVIIDDTFRQQPNFADGLPPDAKVLYLLRTLDKGQLAKAAGLGIGMNDLNAEQQAVLRSILPKSFSYTVWKEVGPGKPAKKLAEATLKGPQVERMKLRISRTPAVEAELAHENGIVNVGGDSVAPGDTIILPEEDMKPTSVYGVQIRQSVPNRAKAADLSYTDPALNASVELKPTTVKALLVDISAASGEEILCDIRVAGKKVEFVGDKARAGDLLQALALSVTGTYRRVGPAYVLTSDLMGLGVRKLLHATWENELSQRTWKQAQEWREQIGDAMIAVPFEPALKPNEALQKHIASADTQIGRADWFPAHQLPQSYRSLLLQHDQEYRLQPVKKDRVRVYSSFRYGFVLPDGRRVRPEYQNLGFGWQFAIRRPNSAGYEPPAVKLPLAIPAKTPLMVSASDAEAGSRLAKQARERGFSELWLETRSADALEGALREALPVRLVIRPWLAISPGELDRTILGDAGSQLDKRLAGLSGWKEYLERRRSEALSPLDRIAPLDVEPVWRQLAQLAQTPGLAGVLLAETAPPGYEPEISPWMSDYTRVFAYTRSFGYSPSMRLAFLRQYSVDPLDIVGRDLHTTSDLRQPFFLDDHLRGSPSLYDGRDTPHPEVAGMEAKWYTFRHDLNKKALFALLKELPQPVLIDFRVSTASSGGVGPLQTLIPWKPGDELPMIEDRSFPQPSPGMVSFVPLPSQWPIAPGDLTAWMLSSAAQRSEFAVAVDARGYTAEGLAVILSRWFTPASKNANSTTYQLRLE